MSYSNFKKAFNDEYSSVAKQLIKHLSKPEKSALVKVDHLAFSFPLADLRHCRGASLTRLSKNGSKAISKFDFPAFPKFYAQRVGGSHDEGLEQIHKHRLVQEKILQNYYIKTLFTFCYHALGFTLSESRNKGFHGYSDSMTLYSKNGAECGFVGIGGQANTCYIQISGGGCKHLFDHISPMELHYWLTSVLAVSKFTRLDLARDCFDNNFTSYYAESAYMDDAFRNGKGGAMVECEPERRGKPTKNGWVYSKDQFTVGRRENPIYWRIYDKRLEQGIKPVLDESGAIDNHWWRNEVELKKWPVDALLNPESAFGGICEFAASMINTVGVRTKAMNKAKEACLDLASRVKWVRHAAGKALGDILKLTNNNLELTVGLILKEELSGKLGLPPTYKRLINYALEH